MFTLDRFALMCFTVSAALWGAAETADAPHRIISTDAVTTETLFALGVGDWVIGRDSGSLYPESVQALPDIGTGHQINAEAILAMRPTLVIGRDRPMSQPGFHLLEAARVKVIRLDDDPGVETGKANIVRLARLLNRESEGDAILRAIDADLAALAEKVSLLGEGPRPRVLVVYLRPNAAILMGDDSNACTFARLTGARSAVPGLTGYKTLNAEAVVAARPDVILSYTHGLESAGGIDGLLAQPGIAETPAARNRRIVAIDDQLLGGFGPRMGKAALELFHGLYETDGPYVVE